MTVALASVPTPLAPATPLARRRREDPDAPVLPRLAAGDDGAMAVLWERYAARVRHLVRRLSGTVGDDLDDTVQETMAKVWRAADAFDPERGTESSFVFTIARRTVIDRWRRRNRRVQESTLAAAPVPADGRAAARLEAVTVALAVNDAVGQLSPRQRQVIELAYHGGRSQREIADQLGVPLGTVKTRTVAALRRLRAELDDGDGVGQVA